MWLVKFFFIVILIIFGLSVALAMVLKFFQDVFSKDPRAENGNASRSRSRKPSDYLPTWNGDWNSAIHDRKDQIARFKRAQSEDVTPTSIDQNAFIGFFPGEDGRPYETTLDKCDCMDFQRRGLPCKHMYRLALETGKIQGEYATGINKNKMLTTIFMLPIECQERLYSLTAGRQKQIVPNDISNERLITSGLCIESTDHFADFAADESISCSELKWWLYSRQDLLEMLPNPKCHKTTLIKWLRETEESNLSFLQEHFTMLELTPQAVRHSTEIYNAYRKKFIGEQHVFTVGLPNK